MVERVNVEVLTMCVMDLSMSREPSSCLGNRGWFPSKRLTSASSY